MSEESNDIDIDNAVTTVGSFAPLVENADPNTFYDVTKLPASKESLIQAFIVVMLSAETNDQANKLGASLMMLSWYQEGVGPTPIKTELAKIAEIAIQEVGNDNLREVAEKMASTKANEGVEVFAKWQATDAEKILEICREIMNTRNSAD